MSSHSETPDWLTPLADAVAAHLAPVAPLAPLGCHVYQEGSVWELAVFAADTEVVGGSLDGQRRPSRFVVDVMPLLCLFTNVFDCTWQPARFDDDDELGAHLAIIGTYREHVVCLRVLSRSPERFPPGRRADTCTKRLEDVW